MNLANFLNFELLRERQSEQFLSIFLSKFLFDRSNEAEDLLRNCLTIKLAPGDAVWRKADLHSRLGSALIAVVVADPAITSEDRHAKLTEAEALLLQGHAALQKAGKVATKYRSDALTRIVRLYEAWQKPEQAAEWREKLKELK